MEVGDIFGKKKVKKPEGNEAVGQTCGLDCRDKSSLERYMGWAHAVAKSPVK